jgi:hypothetical protein
MLSSDGSLAGTRSFPRLFDAGPGSDCRDGTPLVLVVGWGSLLGISRCSMLNEGWSLDTSPLAIDSSGGCSDVFPLGGDSLTRADGSEFFLPGAVGVPGRQHGGVLLVLSHLLPDRSEFFFKIRGTISHRG